MDEVAVLAERIILIDQGRISAVGSTREVFKQSDKLRTIGLELPEIMNIANKLRACGFRLPAALLDPEEALNAISSALEERRVGN